MRLATDCRASNGLRDSARLVISHRTLLQLQAGLDARWSIIETLRLKPRVLYIVYWGAGEPLGQSLVLPAVERLSSLGVDLTLVTFEKNSDADDREYIGGIRSRLEKAGVRWLPLRYHKQPKIPATLYDISRGIARAVALRIGGRFDIVHARTFVGGVMGLLIAPLIGAKLIYHNEGFYPDEQVDAGVWRQGSAPHRVAKWLERKIYSKAHGIIALSRRAKAEIEGYVRRGKRSAPVIVVPSCVDLNLFRSEASRGAEASGELRFVYSGSVGGRYLLDRIGRFVAVAASERGNVHLQVLTRGDRDLTSKILGAGGLAEGLWSVEGLAHTEMPKRLAGQTAGLLFWPRGLSEHGTSPTKVGEYWAMGIPVVATTNISDLDAIIGSEGVGVIVRGHTDADYRRALSELNTLLSDRDLAAKCRRAAERHYALEPSCLKQRQLYEILISKSQVEMITALE